MPDKLTPEQFYKKYYPIVEKKTRGTKIHPETVMAQMAIETGWGAHAPGNNFFGMKGKGQTQTTKEVKNGKTITIQDEFRTYNSFEESLDGYINEITNNPNFKDSLSAKTPEEQIAMLHKGGYATDPNYTNKATSIIKENRSKIKSIMATNNGKPILLSEKENDKGKQIEVQLSDGTVKKYNLKEGNEFVVIGENAYIYEGDKITAKLPSDKNGKVELGEQSNSVMLSPGDAASMMKGGKAIVSISDAYEEEAIKLKDKILKSNGKMTAEDAKTLQSLMELDLISDDYKEDFYKSLSENVFYPIKQSIESRERDLMQKENEKLKGEKSKLDIDDPKRQEIDFKIGKNKESILNFDKDKLWGSDDNTSYAELKNKTDNWFKTVRYSDNPNSASQGGAGGTGSGIGSNTHKTTITTSGSGVVPGTDNYYNGIAGNTQTLDEKAIANDVDFQNSNGQIVVKNQPLNREEVEKSMAEDQALLDAMKNRQETPFVYGPDSQPKRDVVGYLGDVARVAIGMKGANKEVPVYDTSDYFDKYTSDAISRKDMGLLPQEKDYIEKGVEDAYAYDIKNIHRLSGGSAGTALGNLGRASNTLQEGYMKAAAMDVSARDQNWANFANAAGQVESINRTKFEDNLNQVMMDKQAGAGLVADAMTNMLDRKQYEDAYGKGSAYYEYNKYLAENLALSNQILKDQKESLYGGARNMLEESIRKKQEQLNLDNSASKITATGDNYSPLQRQQYGAGIINSVTSADGNSSMNAIPKGEFADGLTVDQIKVMEGKGEQVYPAVVNTKNFRVAKDAVVSKLDSKIAQIKNDMNNDKIDKATASTQLQELQKKRTELLDKLTKEQEAWADTQFDENDTFVGTGSGMPDFKWLEEELKNY